MKKELVRLSFGVLKESVVSLLNRLEYMVLEYLDREQNYQVLLLEPPKPIENEKEVITHERERTKGRNKRTKRCSK